MRLLHEDGVSDIWDIEVEEAAIVTLRYGARSEEISQKFVLEKKGPEIQDRLQDPLSRKNSVQSRCMSLNAVERKSTKFHPCLSGKRSKVSTRTPYANVVLSRMNCVLRRRRVSQCVMSSSFHQRGRFKCRGNRWNET